MTGDIFDYSSAAPAISTSASSWTGILVIGAVIIILLIAMLIVMKRMLGREELHGMSREEIQRRWAEVEKVMETAGGMGAKMAIIEADTLLDSALKSMTMAGSTLGERLKFACYKYPELQKVWYAHKLRNQIVHEATFQLSSGQARSAINDYRKALKTLKVL